MPLRAAGRIERTHLQRNGGPMAARAAAPMGPASDVAGSRPPVPGLGRRRPLSVTRRRC